MAIYYDRYKDFRKNGEVKPLPGIILRESDSDKRVVYELGKSRLDILSEKYYNNPYHGFLIMLANPQFGGLEFDIPDGEIIRIPFPFNSALEEYNNQVSEHLRLYGE